MREILVATRNSGKLWEIKEALECTGLRLVSLKDFEGRTGENLGDPIEDGETFQQNAYKKARYFFDKISVNGRPERFWVLAEDSGIIVDALVGELGIKTRRWGAGERATDQEWVEYFLKKMEKVPENKRGAKFVCLACLIGRNENGEEFLKYFEGEAEGVVTGKLEAPLMSGVPLSSCFKPKGCGNVYSALSHKEKNEISHRGKAMAMVREFLKSRL
mgnify:CR=1 FL=1